MEGFFGFLVFAGIIYGIYKLVMKLGLRSAIDSAALKAEVEQHQAVLKSVAAQLGSSKPIDGLEHILNCWLVGNVPPMVNPSPQPIETVTDDDDDYSQLMEF